MKTENRSNRVLIVEDEIDTLQGMEKLLVKRGYDVDIATNGLEAAEKLKSNRFDIVISDLRMPGLDGIGLLHKAKETDKNVVFIMVTAYGTVDNAVEAMRLGSFDYIPKPFSPAVLIATIERAIQEKESVAPAENRPAVAVPAGERYEIDRAWISVQPDGTVLVGAKEEFYKEAGEILYCDLPLEGDTVTKGEHCITTISTERRVCKQFRCPISGTVVKVNQIMERHPWEAQKDPYGAGWLFTVIPAKLDEEIKECVKHD